MSNYDLDTRLYVNFGGHEIRLNPSNQKNRKALQDAYDKMRELGEVTQWYEQEVEKIQEDGRLKDSTKKTKLKALEDEFAKKSRDYLDSIPQHRKQVMDIMVDEWIGGEPDDEFYSNDVFDDFALGRLLEFFLAPKLTLNDAQSNGSSR